MCPALNKELQQANKLPRGAIQLENGYILLHPTDQKVMRLCQEESDALRFFLTHKCRLQDLEHFNAAVQRRGRARLPNGQVARSVYSELRKNQSRIRIARNVQVFVQIFGSAHTDSISIAFS
jgi:hypothetical protein